MAEAVRLSCPECGAIYAVPAARLAEGRTLRCARCNAVWPVAPEPAEPEPELDREPVIEPVPQASAEEILPILAVEPEPPPLALAGPSAPVATHLPLALAWGASLLVVSGLVAVLLADHRALAAAWPPLLRVYRLVGLA